MDTAVEGEWTCDSPHPFELFTAVSTLVDHPGGYGEDTCWRWLEESCYGRRLAAAAALTERAGDNAPPSLVRILIDLLLDERATLILRSLGQEVTR